MSLSEREFTEIGSLSLFEGLSPKVVDSLVEDAFFKRLKHRELLYRAGDTIESFCLVTQGAFKLVRPTLRGDDVIVYFATIGDIIGALMMDKPLNMYPVSAQAMGPSWALCIPRKTYMSHWSDNAEIQKRLNAVLSTRMSLLQDDKALTKSPLPKRIAALLLNLLERSEHEDSQMIPIPLTRQEIADSLSVTVEAVIRVMSPWDQQGIIRTQDQRIELVKLDQLVDLYRQE